MEEEEGRETDKDRKKVKIEKSKSKKTNKKEKRRKGEEEEKEENETEEMEHTEERCVMEKKTHGSAKAEEKEDGSEPSVKWETKVIKKTKHKKKIESR